MPPSRSSRLFRWFPSLTDAAFILPLVFLFCRMKGAHTLLGDGDTGWHLRTGEWILAHGQVPHADIFSFTRAGQPWFAWEWLWDVLFGWLHLHAGMAAVVLASSLILALTFALLFRMARRRSDALVALAVTVLAAGASAGHWLARPHLLTMLFLVVFYAILDRSAGESAALVAVAAADGVVDQSAWRILYRNHIDRRLCGRGICRAVAEYGWRGAAGRCGAGAVICWRARAARRRPLLILTAGGCTRISYPTWRTDSIAAISWNFSR